MELKYRPAWCNASNGQTCRVKVGFNITFSDHVVEHVLGFQKRLHKHKTLSGPERLQQFCSFVGQLP